MEIKKNSELRFKYVMNIDAQVLSYFCKAFVKRILKIYQTIIDTGINQTNREFLSLMKNLLLEFLFGKIN